MENKKEHSIAWEICTDLKRANKGLIVANILLVVALLVVIIIKWT